MPRSPVPVDGITTAGADRTAPTSADPVNGNSVANSDGQTILWLANTGATGHTMTVRITATVDGLAVNPRTINVAAGQTLICGPYPFWWYGPDLLLDPDSAELTIAAARLGAGLPVAGGSTPLSSPFTAAGAVVVADLAGAGLTLSGSVLIVDTTLTSSTVSGNVLVVTA